MVGKTLSHYRIVEKLGAGGMGEVYKATDLKLGRDVALKVLPEEFARDPERLIRFEQEARLLAALNHPHIAAIHGLEESDGVLFLAMELVPGDTLQEKIANAPLSVGESLGIATQIAEALEAAHDKGIVHRDLKPANIKITPDDQVKILDFGLAKAFQRESSSDDRARSPTITALATRAGTILGTAAYMSPEQARARRVDRRTDVWAFGCVLYEMLTGRAAFAGDTVFDSIASILTRDPDWSALPPATPPAIRRLLRRCLEKNPDGRLRDLGDARLEIEDARVPSGGLAAPEGHGVTDAASRGPKIWPALATLSAVVAVAAIALASWMAIQAGPVADRTVRRLTILLPAESRPADSGATFSLSADGSRLVYAAIYGRTTQLYVRAIDQQQAVPLPGTEGTIAVSFSPDGRLLAFIADNKLKVLALSGGSPTILADAYMPCAPAWASDGTLIYTVAYNQGLARIPIGGGTPVTLTRPDAAHGELGHWHPFLLPDGHSVLFTVWTRGGLPATRIALLDLRTGKSRFVLDGGFAARYVSSGHLIFARPETLMAVPFDAIRGAVNGTPIAVVDDLEVDPNNASPYLAVGGEGTLVYLPSGRASNRIMWAEAGSAPRPIIEERRGYRYPAISPDGRRVAVSLFEHGNADLWMLEPRRGVLTRLTSSPRLEFMPRWTPDGTRLVFVTDTGAFTLYEMPADGSAPPTLLWESGFDKYPGSWSPDGRTLVYVQDSPSTRGDLWLLDVEGEKRARPYLETPFDERGPEFSPDGRFIAFASDESGRQEVYIAPVSGPRAKIRVSTDGGGGVHWARDGRRMYFRNGVTLLSATIQPGTVPTPGAPEIILTDPNMVEGWNNIRNYDVAPDGRHFAIVEGSEGGSDPRAVNVVLNWLEELKRRVPTGTH